MKQNCYSLSFSSSTEIAVRDAGKSGSSFKRFVCSSKTPFPAVAAVLSEEMRGTGRTFGEDYRLPFPLEASLVAKIRSHDLNPRQQNETERK